MIIKQDPITKLWCREDGAVLMPPTGRKFKTFRWTFGSKQYNGYLQIKFHSKAYRVHQVVCRAFNGLAPEGKPVVDHISRIKDDNRPSNLRWVDREENGANADRVDQALEKYGVRCCEDKKAYQAAYHAAHRERIKARSKTHWAARYAEMKSKGLVWKKGPDGKWGWFPRVHPTKEVALCM